MNTKQVKYYEIVSGFFASDIFKDAVVDKYFKEMLKLDYTLAEDLWEYMLIRLDADLKKKEIATLYVDRVYKLFSASNNARVIKTVVDRPVIERAVFRFSPTADGGELFMIPINLFVAGKLDAADGILKLLSQNVAMKPSFGGYMIAFLDKAFIELTKKDAKRHIRLNNKQAALLMSTVQKVKGEEKPMLVQRVKEVM